MYFKNGSTNNIVCQKWQLWSTSKMKTHTLGSPRCCKRSQTLRNQYRFVFVGFKLIETRFSSVGINITLAVSMLGHKDDELEV